MNLYCFRWNSLFIYFHPLGYSVYTADPGYDRRYKAQTGRKSTLSGICKSIEKSSSLLLTLFYIYRVYNYILLNSETPFRIQGESFTRAGRCYKEY